MSSPDLFTDFLCLVCVPVVRDIIQVDQQHVHCTAMVSGTKWNAEVCSFGVFGWLSEEHLCFSPSWAARGVQVEVTPETS